MKRSFGMAIVAALAALSCSDTCKEDLEDANAYVEKVRAQHLSCVTTSDCTTVSVATACGGSCPDVVNLAGTEAVAAAVSHANDELCADRNDCPVMLVDCVVAEPDCVASRCINAALPYAQ